MYNIEWTRGSSRSRRAQRDWGSTMGKNLYFHFYLFCSRWIFEGVSMGGPYRWSTDQSVRWSVDPVHWTGPRTGGQCFRVTRFLRSYARAEMYKLCKSTGPRYLTSDSRLRRSSLALPSSCGLFSHKKMVIKEERDCLQSTSTEDMNKGSLHSNVLLGSSDLKWLKIKFL